MTAFESAWDLIKMRIDINTCASCLENAPTIKLEMPYKPPSTELCEKCWDEEMTWRIEQQKKHPKHNHLFPLLPWPLGEYE